MLARLFFVIFLALCPGIALAQTSQPLTTAEGIAKQYGILLQDAKSVKESLEVLIVVKSTAATDKTGVAAAHITFLEKKIRAVVARSRTDIQGAQIDRMKKNYQFNPPAPKEFYEQVAQWIENVQAMAGLQLEMDEAALSYADILLNKSPECAPVHTSACDSVMKRAKTLVDEAIANIDQVEGLIRSLKPPSGKAL